MERKARSPAPALPAGACPRRWRETLQERLEPLLQDRCGRWMPPALESEVLLARQRSVELDRIVNDLIGLCLAAPDVELDSLALLQVLVVVEDVDDALESVRVDVSDVVDCAVCSEHFV